MSERIDALEFKVAHLERALQELSDVVYRQQLEERGGDPNRVEIPPHY